jgi:hypothetical protein
VSDIERRLRRSRRKKSPRRPTLRNRYHRRAKLSEYKFLQVLQGFADDLPIDDAAKRTRISSKTVRALYRGLREKLIAAALHDPFAFGGAGRFLIDNGRLGDRGRRFLEELAKTETYDRHLQRHAPRIGGKANASVELFECAVRSFCTMSMRNKPEEYYPPETLQALQTFHEIAAWIAENRKSAEFLEERAQLLSRFVKITDQLPRLLEKEDLLALKSHARPHRYPGNVLYEDLRRYLLRDPL